MIAKSRVGWMVAGWAPDVCTRESRVWFHSTTTLPALALDAVGSAALAAAVRDVAAIVVAATSATPTVRRRGMAVRCFRGMTGLRSGRCGVERWDMVRRPSRSACGVSAADGLRRGRVAVSVARRAEGGPSEIRPETSSAQACGRGQDRGPFGPRGEPLSGHGPGRLVHVRKWADYADVDVAVEQHGPERAGRNDERKQPGRRMPPGEQQEDDES